MTYSSRIKCLHPMEELNVISVVSSLTKKIIEILSQHKLHVKVLEHAGNNQIRFILISQVHKKTTHNHDGVQ